MWKQVLSLALAIVIFTSIAHARPHSFRRLQVDNNTEISLNCSNNLFLGNTSGNASGDCWINGVHWICTDQGCSNGNQTDSFNWDLSDHPFLQQIFGVLSRLFTYLASLGASSAPSSSEVFGVQPVTQLKFWNNSLVNLTNIYQSTDGASQDFSCSNNTQNCSYVIGVLNCTNAVFNFNCDNRSECQWLIITQDSANITANDFTTGGSASQLIILSRNSSGVNSFTNIEGSSYSANVFGLYTTENFNQGHNCSEDSNCTNNVTTFGSSGLSQENWCWGGSHCNHLLKFSNADVASQQDVCWGDNTVCNSILSCVGSNCTNVSQVVDCGGNATCNNVTGFDGSVYAAVVVNNFSTPDDACSGIDVSAQGFNTDNLTCIPYNVSTTTLVNNTNGINSVIINSNASAPSITYIDIFNNRPGPLDESDTSFSNFSAELDAFYANFSNNSCNSLADCVDEGPVLDWINSQACTLGSGDSCDYTNYSHSVEHSNCSANNSICNETIVSLSNVEWVWGNWSWDQGQHARNAFVFQNASNLTIVGECSNGTYCQNLFILNNVSDVTINITCSDNAICDNIIAEVSSSDVSEWVDCSNSTTCALNVFHQVESNNSWQWANCSDSSTCGQQATGRNVSNVTQVNEAWTSSVSQNLVFFFGDDGLTQNNTCGNTSVCQNLATCDTDCSGFAQNNDCQDGSVCTNSTSPSENATESNASEPASESNASEPPAESNSTSSDNSSGGGASASESSSNSTENSSNSTESSSNATESSSNSTESSNSTSGDNAPPAPTDNGVNVTTNDTSTTVEVTPPSSPSRRRRLLL